MSGCEIGQSLASPPLVTHPLLRGPSSRTKSQLAGYLGFLIEIIFFRKHLFISDFFLHFFLALDPSFWSKRPSCDSRSGEK